MSDKPSNKHPNYENLYRLPGQPCWIYRKYSSEKGKRFYCSTGLEATDRNAAAAYKIGVSKFNDWLGIVSTDGVTRIQDIARTLYNEKDGVVSDATLRAFRNQIEKHIIPAWGRKHPRDVTKKAWQDYEKIERRKPRTQTLKDGTEKQLPPRKKLFNTRKAMIEILLRAKSLKLIEEVPELPMTDTDADPPREIPKEDVLRIIRFSGRIAAHQHKGRWVKECRYRIVPLKLLVFIMWKQGARPSEILQYQWSMIHWQEGEFGTLYIPAEITKTREARQIPLNPKVARILRFLHARKESPWIFPSPTVPGERIKDYSSAWDSTMERLGIDFTIYNLRDTFITRKLEEGRPPIYIGKYCGTSATMIEDKYAASKRTIMEGIAE